MAGVDDQELRDALTRLIDRHLIEDVVVRYATALDSQDWELLRSCFTDDAIADYGTKIGRFEGADAIVAACREPLSGLDSSQHLLGNMVIEVTGDTAIATVYVHAQHFLVNDQGASTAVMGGTYIDELTRTANGWRISVLRFEISWRSGNPGILGEAGMGALAEAREERQRGRS